MILATLVCCAVTAPPSYADAKSILDRYRDSVYQVIVINLDSQGRSSLGSGFLIDDGSKIVTNYHVVSEAILSAEKYRIEVIDNRSNIEQVNIDRIDIINDLVILKRSSSSPDNTIDFAAKEPDSGDPVFSIGNPHDIGLTVVPGTYNGLEARNFIDVIHFSGSINQGMSGGPAINKDGDAIGINVATSGNQISFLIPINKLHKLLNIPQDNNSFNHQIQKQIKAQQAVYFDSLFSQNWNLTELNQAQIISEISADMACWGDSDFDQESSISSITMGCNGKHDIYISNNFSTGNVEYEYWLAESHDLSSIRFYNYIEKRLESYLATNASSDDLVSNFHCNNDFVALPDSHKANMRSSLCVRHYVNFPELHDVFFVASSYQKNTKVLISHFTLQGVDINQTKTFTEKFMRSVKWL